MNKVIRLKDRREIKINVGIVIICVLCIYTIIIAFLYLTKKRVSAYEVNLGNITDISSYKGFIIREENTVTSAFSGSLNYLVTPNERVNTGKNICCIDDTGKVDSYLQNLKQKDKSFDNSDIKKLNSIISDYKNSYNSVDFSNTYQLSKDLDETVSMCLTENVINDLNSYISSNAAFNTISTNQTGIIVYGYDSYEKFNEKDLTYSIFSEKYEYTDLNSKKTIRANEIAYKIVTNETWNIYIKLTDKEADKLKYKQNADIKFLDSGIVTSADFTIYTNEHGVFGKLTLNRYMNEYASARFVDIELINIDVTGIKIPKSAMVYKDFYRVPKSIMKKGNDDDDSYSLMIKRKNKKGEYVTDAYPVVIYHSDEENFYIDKNFVKKDDIILGADANTVYELSDTLKLPGVYRINKGYAVFRKINILDENEDYYIIESNSELGIKVYDHIVQDGSSVKENEIIY